MVRGRQMEMVTVHLSSSFAVFRAWHKRAGPQNCRRGGASGDVNLADAIVPRAVSLFG
jgi:hypothetical protein